MPSFIIGGAAKSGTSTLHHLLNRSPDVFIPDHELYLFSIDDIQQHPEFFVDSSGQWVTRDFDANREEYLAWYESFFSGAPPDAVLGEDSTSYLPSARAARRIRLLIPQVKLIFLLRDPAPRTYSQYWHDLRVGRVVDGFEETLRHAPGTLLQRSMYVEQVQTYRGQFPRGQLLFLLFEELVRDPTATLREVTEFLGIPMPPATDTDTEVHRNPARVPRSMRLQLWRNRLLRGRTAARFQAHLPGSAGSPPAHERLVSGRWAKLNLRQDRQPPPMRAATHRFLDDLFRHESAGLSELIGRDVSQHWYRGPRP